MLTREEALAMADAMTAPAEAERLRRAERRTARLLWVYPMLKQVPAQRRAALLFEAQEHAMRRWTVIAAGLLTLLAVSSPFISRATGGWFPAVNLGMPVVPLAILAVMLLNYFYSRRFLKSEVPARYPVHAVDGS